MADKKRTVKLFFAYECKHSVRYNAVGAEGNDVITSVYLMRDAFEEFDKPKGIEVTIKAVQ